MQDNAISQEQIFAAIKNQIVSSYPPETKTTFSRLVRMGFNESETYEMISQCLSIEYADALMDKKAFDRNRYVRNLNLLPQLP